jgi:hypothetical protein
MVEKGYTQEVAGLISQLKHFVLSDNDDPETLKSAWRTYLEIKEKNLRPEPTTEEELNNIRRAVGKMESSGLSANNPARLATCYGIRVDLGLNIIPSLIGDLTKEQKDKVDSYINKMCDFLIRK